MTTEDKQILLQDLCARLPYGVILQLNLFEGEMIVNSRLTGIDEDGNITVDIPADCAFSIEDAKPYLRPMSSMTEEELNECVCQSGIKDIECPNWQDIPKEKQFEARLNHAIAVFLTDSNDVDWLNAHHFDYRGLIDMRLAVEAPEGMYNI